jgi:hypothetical protein
MRSAQDEKIELADVASRSVEGSDHRRRIPEPLPVRLVVVEDAQVLAPPGLKAELDQFYVDLLRFEREPKEAGLVYRADNARLMVKVRELPRDNMRPLGIQVPSLRAMEVALAEAEVEFVRQKGIVPGQGTLLVQDPAGNWVELSEAPTMW